MGVASVRVSLEKKRNVMWYKLCTLGKRDPLCPHTYAFNVTIADLNCNGPGAGLISVMLPTLCLPGISNSH